MEKVCGLDAGVAGLETPKVGMGWWAPCRPVQTAPKQPALLASSPGPEGECTVLDHVTHDDTHDVTLDVT